MSDTTVAPEKTYTIETKEQAASWDDSGFRHRVGCSDGRVSRWAPYSTVSFLDDCASVSPYFTDGNEMQTMSVREAMGLLAYGEETNEELLSLKDS